ncbi:hypothetical protein GCM10020331_004190 [Ectobacillus funiculus]
MNIRKELEKFIDTRPFNDKQLCEMWKKWRKTINNSKHVSKEKNAVNIYATTNYLLGSLPKKIPTLIV